MLVKAQVTIRGATGLPSDVYVNTYHFQSLTPPSEADYDDLSQRIINAYTTQLPGTTGALHTLYAFCVSGEGHSVKLYNLDEPQPRVPFFTQYFDLPSAVGGSSLPTQVACVGSYHAAPQSGIPMARRRGRVYFGPFSEGNAVRALDANSGEVKPAPELTARIIGCLSHIRGVELGLVWQWVVHSPTSGPLARYPVVGGWVDNRFDTQRRRLSDATQRTFWGADVAP
jgi:hypothetical protein